VDEARISAITTTLYPTLFSSVAATFLLWSTPDRSSYMEREHATDNAAAEAGFSYPPSSPTHLFAHAKHWTGLLLHVLQYLILQIIVSCI